MSSKNQKSMENAYRIAGELLKDKLKEATRKPWATWKA